MKKGRLAINVEAIGIGELCNLCNKPMQRRKHKFLSEKQKQAPYHFSEWDVCISGCNYMKHYDKYKVHHNNHMDI